MVESVLITGATSAIGAALARAYAEPGVALHLHGRDASRLAAVADACRTAGATVTTFLADVRDIRAMDGWLRGFAAVDLVIINAGAMAIADADGGLEPWEQAEQVLDVNLKAAIAAVHAVVPAMRRRGRGQIALMSSLAGFYGVPVMPTYSASKAGLKAYGEALRPRLAADGIQVSVVMPGFVSSPMCHAIPGPKPGILQPEAAAALIKRRLARNPPRIAFPVIALAFSWLLAVVPASWQQRLVVRIAPSHG